MSEFECKNGHLMLPSEGPTCRICGARVGRMDGYTNSQWKKIEEGNDYEREDDTPEPTNE